MTDKMREAFERWAKSECLDTDSVDGFYSDNDTHIAWGSWQAAQSSAVPVEVMDSRCTYAAFAGRVCNKCGRIHDGGKSVPVVGEADKMAESISGMVMEWVTAASAPNGDWQSGLARIIRKRIERFQPTTSISAAELAKIRAYIADGIESEGVTEHDHSIEARKLVKIIDAAIDKEAK